MTRPATRLPTPTPTGTHPNAAYLRGRHGKTRGTTNAVSDKLSFTHCISRDEYHRAWGSSGRRFKSCHPDHVISQEIGNGLNLWFGPFCFGFGAFGFAGGLVVAGWVEGELAEEFSGVGGDDADVEVLYE